MVTNKKRYLGEGGGNIDFQWTSPCQSLETSAGWKRRHSPQLWPVQNPEKMVSWQRHPKLIFSHFASWSLRKCPGMSQLSQAIGQQ